MRTLLMLLRRPRTSPRREQGSEAPIMRIFISAGEPSGDLHGANLIRALRQQQPGIECVGFGGLCAALFANLLRFFLTLRNALSEISPRL